MKATSANAAALRAEHGWGYKRIARELGVSRDKVRGWLWRGTCEECGGPTGAGHRGRERTRRCLDCYRYRGPA